MNDLLTTLNPVPDAPLTDAEAQVADELLEVLLGEAGGRRPSWRWAVPVAAVGLFTAGVVGAAALRPPMVAIAPGAGPALQRRRPRSCR